MAIIRHLYKKGYFQNERDLLEDMKKESENKCSRCCEKNCSGCSEIEEYKNKFNVWEK